MTTVNPQRARRRSESREPDPLHGRCAYTYGNGERCPLPGAHCQSLAHGGASSPKIDWFCFFHDDPRHKLSPGPDQLDQLADLKRHQAEILANRDQSTRSRSFDALVDAELASHPEWRRKAGESASEYRARRREFIAPLWRRGHKTVPK